MTIYTYKQACARYSKSWLMAKLSMPASGDAFYLQKKMLEEYLQRNTAKPVLSRKRNAPAATGAGLSI